MFSWATLMVRQSHWNRKNSPIKLLLGCSNRNDPPLATHRAMSSVHLSWVTQRSFSDLVLQVEYELNTKGLLYLKNKDRQLYTSKFTYVYIYKYKHKNIYIQIYMHINIYIYIYLAVGKVLLAPTQFLWSLNKNMYGETKCKNIKLATK